MPLKDSLTAALSEQVRALREDNESLQQENASLKTENHRLRVQVANANRRGGKGRSNA